MMVLSHIFYGVHLMGIMVPAMIATFGQALIFPNAIAGAIQNASQAAGKASATFSSLQLITISLFSAIMAVLPDNNALSFVNILIGLGLLAGLTFWRYLKYNG